MAKKEEKILADWCSYEYVAGLDEVGRGCGAGPVVTAAVIMPKGFKSPLIRDSKVLSEKKRQKAYDLIMDNAIAVSCNAGSVGNVNSLGINGATFKSMHRCIDELAQRPEYVLVDGTTWEDYKGENANAGAITLIPRGDDKYTCIAAAAIVAKVRRDEYMTKLGELHPEYKWGKNKGYLTPDHISAIKKHGSNKYHRVMFIKNFL